jgi:hypothetical protein
LQGIVMARGPFGTFVTGTSSAESAFSPQAINLGVFHMPLFFIIAIGAGAFTLGATAVDVTSDVNAQRRDPTVQAQQMQPQQMQPQQLQFRTLAECQQAAVQQGHPPSVCQQRS